MNTESNVSYRWSPFYMLRLIMLTAFPCLLIALACYFLVDYFSESLISMNLSQSVLTFIDKDYYISIVLAGWVIYVLYKCIVSIKIDRDMITIRRLFIKVLEEDLGDVDVRIVSTKMNYTNQYHGQRFFKTLITPQSVKAIVLYNNGVRKRFNISGLGRNNAEALGERLSWYFVTENKHSNQPMR